jgi:glycosyltransferase involved in cell wall biosynthesis
MELRGIKYVAPIYDGSGYAQASRGNILALHELGVPLTLKPISFEPVRPKLGADNVVLKELENKEIDYNVVLVHTTPEFWSEHRENDKVNVGYTIWETDKIHESWPKFINRNVDKVLVGCKWNVEIFKNCGVEVPVGVVPHGINVKEFDGVEPYEVAGIDKDAYVFYFIGQWTERKGVMHLIKAYWHAFQDDENVALILKTYRNDYSENEKQVVRETLTRLKAFCPADCHPKIYLISDLLTRDEILGLHKRGDCFVSLDRGEGFGLNAFTSGACGDPIIVTGFGGVTEYANKDNSYLVDYSLTPVTHMPWSPWYKINQRWASPNVCHGAELMKRVFNNQEEAKGKGRKLGEFIKNEFSWKKIGQKIVEEIRGIVK